MLLRSRHRRISHAAVTARLWTLPRGLQLPQTAIVSIQTWCSVMLGQTQQVTPTRVTWHELHHARSITGHLLVVAIALQASGDLLRILLTHFEASEEHSGSTYSHSGWSDSPGFPFPQALSISASTAMDQIVLYLPQDEDIMFRSIRYRPGRHHRDMKVPK